jgi:hypothetical protein
MINKKNKDLVVKKGFTIIEALVLLFIFVIITTTFYRFFSSATVLILESKKKLVAINAANERIEFIRSLPYGEVEIGAKIDDNEDIVYGGYQFNVITSISYGDDEFDGTGSDDDSPNDYKKIIVTTSWGSGGEGKSVSASTTVAPFGEEVGIGGGILNVSAIDITGSPVGGVQVNVANSSPLYNKTLTTNANGQVSFIGIPADNQGYVISLSKSDYESGVTTLPPYPTTSYYPANVHASVVNANTTNSIFSFSMSSDMKIKFINPVDETSIPDVNFSMEGGRVLGTNLDTSLFYNYKNLSLSSNSSGEKEFSNLSPGQYTINVNEPGYVFWKTDAGTGNNANEILLAQGEDGDTKDVFLLNEETDSYFIKIVDSITNAPVEGVEIIIENETLGFSDTIITDEYGYAFSPAKSDPLKILENGETYQISISKDGYDTKTGSVDIDGLVERG